MTVDELTFLLERLAAAGCGAEQLVAAAQAARDWRVERRLLLAVKRAVAPANTDSAAVPVRVSASDPVPESAFVAPDGRKATARKALLMSGRLKLCARKVGAVLIDRFNLDTGRCDASVQTLADDAGYDLRSARRAIGELVAAGLFNRALQSGRGHTNRYTPSWEALAALARETENTDSQNRTRGRNPDGRVRQNHTDLSPSVMGERSVAHEPPRQMELPVPQVVGGTDSARQRALFRTEAALRGKYRAHNERRAMLAGLIGLGQAEQDLVADAELRAAGGGIRTFEALLRQYGPPRRASGGG